MPVRVAGPPLACPYCQSPQPLEPRLAARVEALRTKLGSHDGREQLLMGRQTQLAGSVGCMYFAMTSSAFLLFLAPVPLYIELPADRSWLWFLQTVHVTPTDGSIGLNTWWWYLTFLLFGWSLVLLTTALTAVRVRRVVRFALPLAPVGADRPPRCRVCGGELPAQGAIRRCPYCSADHVVTGQRFQRQQAQIEGALDQIEARIETSLGARERAAEWTMAFAVVFSALGILGAAVGAIFFDATQPSLLIGPLVVIPLSLLLYLLQSLLVRIPKIPSITDAVPGSEVRIRGTSYQVLDYLNWWSGNPDELRFPLLLLGHGDAPQLALKGQWEEGVLLGQVLELVPSAPPYAGEELSSFDPHEHSRLRLPPKTPIRVAGKAGQLRLWIGDPEQGMAPTLTLRSRGRTRPHDVVIIPA